MSDYPRILTAGDSALVVEFGNTIDPAVNRRVYDLAAAVEAAGISGVSELVPTYRSLLVGYDCLQTSYDETRSALEDLLSERSTQPAHDDTPAGTLFEIPVAYGGASGPDLERVAEHAGMSTDDVVEIHSAVAYRVYMLGFLPGFPYLGGMDGRIACPRLETPRLRVPAGSVGIAESQTGVYPMESPGGWQLIGRTPAPLFDPDSNPPAALAPGSFVRFVSKSATEIAEIESAVATGTYRVPSSEYRA